MYKASGTEGMESIQYQGESRMDSRYPRAYMRLPQIGRLLKHIWNPVLVATAS
jgi:hypothetical protein